MKIRELTYNPEEDTTDEYPFAIDFNSWDKPEELDERARKILDK
jgi:hypothetical protein